MAFIAGAGATNVDLLYENMPRIPGVGEEIYTNSFSCQLGGGLPATPLSQAIRDLAEPLPPAGLAALP